MKVRSWPLASACFLAFALSAACSGGGGSDETPTIPTVDAVAEQTQAAVNTEEAGALATSTRAPGPEEQPTVASGTIVLATSAGLVESGLLDVLVPMFEGETGYTVQIMAANLADVLADASTTVDVTIGESPPLERGDLRNDNGFERTLIMHSEFVLVGSTTDPALVRAQERADDALRSISDSAATFITPPDGTTAQAVEMRLWKRLEVTPQGAWYQTGGQDSADTLALASERQGYTIADLRGFLADRGTLDLEVLLSGDPALLNVYHALVLDPAWYPNANITAGRALAAFLVRPDVQQVIGEFGVAEFGESIFVAEAGKPEPIR